MPGREDTGMQKNRDLSRADEKLYALNGRLVEPGDFFRLMIKNKILLPGTGLDP
jgi:hypothetical protein